jgi:CheY-like chemotaxis protein
MEKPRSLANKQQILIVDDEPFFCTFLREKFEELGYSVGTAGDAFAALDVVRRTDAPLIVLLDLMLPTMSGPQLLRELANSENASEIRVIFVSAHHTVATVAPRHPMVMGREQKPVDLGELTRMVEAAARDLPCRTSAREP